MVTQKEPNIVDYLKGGYDLYKGISGLGSTLGNVAGPQVIGTAGGNPGLAALSTSGTGAGAGSGLAGLATSAGPAVMAALAAMVASNVVNEWGVSNPYMVLRGSERGLDPAPTDWLPGTSGDDRQLTDPNVWAAKPSNITSNAGFDYGISTGEYENSDKVGAAVRDYLDAELTNIQNQTDMDVNDILKYSKSLVNFSGGGDPMSWAESVVNRVAESVATGNPFAADTYAQDYEQPGQYVSGVESYRVGGEGTGESTSEYYDRRRPIYSALPTTTPVEGFSYTASPFAGGVQQTQQTQPTTGAGTVLSDIVGQGQTTLSNVLGGTNNVQDGTGNRLAQIINNQQPNQVGNVTQDFSKFSQPYQDVSTPSIDVSGIRPNLISRITGTYRR